MSITITPSTDLAKVTPVGDGFLGKYLANNGRMPPVSILVYSLEKNTTTVLDKFLTYKFQSSILIPVDTFSLTLLIDDDAAKTLDLVKEGDLVYFFGNNVQFATGRVDSIDIEVDADFGEKVTITGRDLLAQWEDQDSVSLDSKPIFAGKSTVAQVVALLARDTRINPSPILRDAPTTPQNFATQPGETKLSAFQRYVESLNVLFWMSADGKLIVGKPNFTQAPRDRLFLSKERRDSNVLSMRATRASATIPNIIVPIFNGQEVVQDRLKPEQILYNSAFGPTRLRKLGDRFPKAVVVSTPDGASAQEQADVTFLGAAVANKAGYGNLLQAYGKRELARKNKDELIVQAQVFGHYDSLGNPFVVDTMFSIDFDRGSVSEDMYLFQCDYDMAEGTDQITNLYFCKKNTLVSDLRVK